MGFWKTWKKVMFEPMEFFEKMPKKVSISDASKYYLKIKAIFLAIQSVFLLIFVGIFSSIFGIFGIEGIALGGAFFGIYALVVIIGFPLRLLLSWGFMFWGAGLLHLLAMMFGSKEKYKESVKIISYASTPNLLAFIPVISFIVKIYSIILQV
ncbi:YIP1 family protein, partial [Candidatus Woesearchaeota archaeon]|nr:YIP1 family protein [Candidatus Woesearchaeota archaeon]